MIVRKHLDPRIILRVAWKRVLALALVSSVVVFAHHHLWINLKLDTMPASILGVAIAFLIGFRVNSAYERWWEARRIWGAITNDSRSLARQTMTFFTTTNPSEPENENLIPIQNRIIHRQIAFCYALKGSLRKQDFTEELRPFISDQELTWLKTHRNVPNALLLQQAVDLKEAHARGYIEDFRHMQLDTRLSALNDSMGACERIKNTVFPRQYSYYSTLFVKLFTFLLPFIFVSSNGWLTVPLTIIIGFIFFALDTIAGGIENPFENTINDTPMTAICRNIEINLLQMLGEENIPAPHEPKNGFLY